MRINHRPPPKNLNSNNLLNAERVYSLSTTLRPLV